jgi:hypothetical protein
MKSEQYLKPRTRRGLPFEMILSYMEPQEVRNYLSYRHVRVELVKVGQRLVAYTVDEDERPDVKMVVTIDDMGMTDDNGLFVGVVSDDAAGDHTVGFAPSRPFGIPVYLHIPLNPGLLWSPSPSDVEKGHFEFPIVIRTESRFSLREEGVMHLEKLEDFTGEFGIEP